MSALKNLDAVLHAAAARIQLHQKDNLPTDALLTQVPKFDQIIRGLGAGEILRVESEEPPGGLSAAQLAALEMAIFTAEVGAKVAIVSFTVPERIIAEQLLARCLRLHEPGQLRRHLMPDAAEHQLVEGMERMKALRALDVHIYAAPARPGNPNSASVLVKAALGDWRGCPVVVLDELLPSHARWLAEELEAPVVSCGHVHFGSDPAPEPGWVLNLRHRDGYESFDRYEAKLWSPWGQMVAKAQMIHAGCGLSILMESDGE